MNNENQPRFGFVNFAETWNGRMAMMGILIGLGTCLLYTSPSPRDRTRSRMPSSA